MKLKKGDSINELTLPSVDGSTFNLETIKGKKAMISFYRYSSCPFCHLRINEIISKKSEFGDNFVPIAIFDCDFDDLVKNSKKHDGEITILCDDDRIYFDKYEVQNSFLRFLVGITIRVDRFFKALLKGYNPASNMSGAFLGLPADILVDENGIVQKALYGSHTANHIPLKEVVQFSKS